MGLLHGHLHFLDKDAQFDRKRCSCGHALTWDHLQTCRSADKCWGSGPYAHPHGSMTKRHDAVRQALADGLQVLCGPVGGRVAIEQRVHPDVPRADVLLDLGDRKIAYDISFITV